MWGPPTQPPEEHQRIVAAAAPGAWPLPTGETVIELIDRFERVATLKASWADTVAEIDLYEPATVVNAATAAAVMLERVRRETGHVDRYETRLHRYQRNRVLPHGVDSAVELTAVIDSVEQRRQTLVDIGSTVDTWLRFQHGLIVGSKSRIWARLFEIVDEDWVDANEKPVVASWWPLGGALRTSDTGLMETSEWKEFAMTLMGRAIEFGRTEIINHPSVQEELALRRAGAPFRSAFSF